jgi:hypothetical protein
MGKRRDIRAALVASMQTVSVANGYALTVGEVIVGPVRIPDGIQAYPHVSVLRGEEVKALQAFGRKQCVLTFFVGVACKRSETTDPEEECDDVCAELERAIERSPIDPGGNGKWLNLSYVTNVFVSNIDPLDTSPEIAPELATSIMTVDVTYNHDRRNP